MSTPAMPRVRVRDVLEASAKVFRVDVADLIAVGRTGTTVEICYARQAAFAIAARITGKTYADIGVYCGGRGRDQVFVAAVAGIQRLASEPELAIKVEVEARRLAKQWLTNMRALTKQPIPTEDHP